MVRMKKPLDLSYPTDSEVSDQTGQMPWDAQSDLSSLGAQVVLLVWSCGGSYHNHLMFKTVFNLEFYNRIILKNSKII